MKSISVLLCILSTVSAAPQTFVLRHDSTGQGIMRYDSARTPVADFIYHTTITPEGRLALSAFADRLLLQGTAFFEFDAATGQLLRRYPGLGLNFGAWTFQGQVITDEDAGTLGIPAGVYGTPYCPPSGGVATICASAVPFPGYDTMMGNVVKPNILLRRSLDPTLASLTIAKSFASPDFMVRRRLITVDPTRHRLLFTLTGIRADGITNVVRQTSATTGDGIGNETTTSEVLTDPSTPSLVRRVPTSIAFDTRDNLFVGTFNYIGAYEDRLLTRNASGEEETLLQIPAPPFLMNGVTTLPATLPSTYVQLVPTIGHTDGANGTSWRSDVWLFNPADSATTATVRTVSDPTRLHEFPLAAHGSTRITDAAVALGAKNVDALIVESPFRVDAQLSVYSRTYTPASEGGTYGEAVPAVPSLVGYSNHLDRPGGTADMSESESSLIVLDKRDPQRFRHNLGIVNTAEQPLTVRLRYALVSSINSGDPSREQALTIPPHTVRIVTIEALFPPMTLEILPPRIQINADRPAPIWLSMIDNLTGDASFIPFSIYSIEAPAGTHLVIPAVSHTAGANGTQWSTDLYGFFAGPTETSVTPEATFYPASTCPSSTRRLASSPGAQVTPQFPWTTFWNTCFLDIARQFCATDDVRGALEINTAAWTSAWARIYTTAPDGGTFGEMLPLYPPLGYPVRHFSGIQSDDEFRVNIGLYNALDTANTVELRLYAADGTQVGTRQVTLGPHESTLSPLQSYFGAVANGLYGVSVVPLGVKSCWPYISVVDNKTGDPTNWW